MSSTVISVKNDSIHAEYVCVCMCVKIPAGETADPIPPCLLRKYISYARQYVHPSLSPEAAQTIQDFYLSLRSQSHSADSTPITTRQLESLIRLTEVAFYMFALFTHQQNMMD